MPQPDRGSGSDEASSLCSLGKVRGSRTLSSLSTHRPRTDSAPRERGQALVELALVAPILVLILVAIFQFAYVLETQIGLTNALREAARRAAAAPNPTVAWVQLQLDGDGTPSNKGLLAQNVQGYQSSRATETITFCRYTVAGVTGNNDRVDIGITYNHPVFFPILSFVTGSPTTWTLTSQAEMRLETDLTVDPGACP
jgi:Flp pilus assembly protein TadG